MVKFGNVDSNEDYEHEGQSVTQQCKSYLFDLNDKLRLRIIDTPGIGDTRGVAQDVKNIDHILTYTNNLSHLNAVCLLLKPNASRLNVFFRSCVHQLLTYLTPAGYENIIFCFTNSRATFLHQVILVHYYVKCLLTNILMIFHFRNRIHFVLIANRFDT